MYMKQQSSWIFFGVGNLKTPDFVDRKLLLNYITLVHKSCTVHLGKSCCRWFIILEMICWIVIAHELKLINKKLFSNFFLDNSFRRFLHKTFFIGKIETHNFYARKLRGMLGPNKLHKNWRCWGIFERIGPNVGCSAWTIAFASTNWSVLPHRKSGPWSPDSFF